MSVCKTRIAILANLISIDCSCELPCKQASAHACVSPLGDSRGTVTGAEWDVLGNPRPRRLILADTQLLFIVVCPSLSLGLPDCLSGGLAKRMSPDSADYSSQADVAFSQPRWWISGFLHCDGVIGHVAPVMDYNGPVWGNSGVSLDSEKHLNNRKKMNKVIRNNCAYSCVLSW